MIINLIQSEQSENVYINEGDLAPVNQINAAYNMLYEEQIDLHNTNEGINILVNLGDLVNIEDINNAYNKWE